MNSFRHFSSNQSKLAALLVVGLVTLLAPCPAASFPEYLAELPTNPEGAPGVGHVAKEGGGLRNSFGKDFALAGYTWTKALCQKDSDGDGFTNGQELGDPNCKWRKGQPKPQGKGLRISHPGLKSWVPTPAPVSNATGQGVAAHKVAWIEPNADMPVPQGSERNLQGDKPQQWCAARDKLTAQKAPSTTPIDRQWLNFSLPDMTVLGTPDMYSCHPFRIPEGISDEREFVGVRVGLDGESHLHHILLMECPGDLWFLEDITRNSEMCTTHSGTMFAACNRWWIATEANNDYRMCTPPGLIYARAGEMKKNNKVLVLQVHWVFGKKTQNTSVALNNATLELLHEAPQAGQTTEVMETIEGTAIYPPSVLQHVNGLVIPAGQEAYESSYKCGRRCTYVPLGKLSPAPVTIAGYTFHGHHYMTGMRMSIKRCPLTRLPDVTWEVTDWQQSVVHPTYDVTGQAIKLYPGDELSWTCIYNTSQSNRTVYGGYAGYKEEMCIMLLHYYPRNAMLRGCSAVMEQQGGHSMCMYEAASMINYMNEEANVVPVRTLLSPRTLPSSNSSGASLVFGYKASIIVFWALLLTAFMWAAQTLLGRCRSLGAVHKAFTALSKQHRRNMVVYVMHCVFDTIILALWVEPLLGGWCGCTESAPSHGWLLGFNLLYIVVAYMLELVWRERIDVMLSVHHIATILIISVLFGELAYKLMRYGDAVIVLGLFAVLEQPTFVALLLKRVLPAGSVHVTRAWFVAVWWWFASKGASVVLAVWFIIRDWSIMPAWARGTYIALWALMSAIQFWSGMIQCSILRGIKYEQLQQEQATQLLSQAATKLASGVTIEHEDACKVGPGNKDCLVVVN